MGRQYNPRQKRARAKAYMKRKKAAKKNTKK